MLYGWINTLSVIIYSTRDSFDSSTGTKSQSTYASNISMQYSTETFITKFSIINIKFYGIDQYIVVSTLC